MSSICIQGMNLFLLRTLFVILFSVPSSLFAQTSNVQAIDSLMTKVHKYGIFNGNVLVAKNGRVIYESSFGYADGGKKNHLDAGYIFSIGSISKEFNAVAIMMLKEQGKLSLDDKVSKFFNFLPAWAEKITIRHLLQYSSGLPDVEWENVKTDQDNFNNLKKLQKLDFEPGTNYAYNNNNVFLQRRIIEKISGMPFEKFVRTNMLVPCKMANAVIDPDMHGPKIVRAFNDDFQESARQDLYPISGWTAVTANDLFKWSECLHQFKLIGKSSVIELLKPYAPGKQCGLGSGGVENDSVKEQYHHGSSGDFEALMYNNLVEKTTIILLTNNKNQKVFEIKDAIRAILKGEKYTVPKKSVFQAIQRQITNASFDEIMKAYHKVKSNNPTAFDDSDERDFNEIGYFLMSKGQLDDAIKIFELNVKNYPTSANAYDSLGEAFLNKGNKKSALENYKKAFAMDPDNLNAKAIISKLEGEM
jgi:CubicO group peptidase (beta-lactamase class C family)